MSTDRQPTEQQQRAVRTRGTSVLLSSGAGCGKTTVLTDRYLSHLRDDAVEVGQIVAITFTERAAREMRQRIRGSVLTSLRQASSDLDAERWARHLRNLESATIGTIHSFCGSLLRHFAVEAGLDPRFDVLEEVLSVNLEAEALSNCLQKLLTAQGDTGQDLRELVLIFGWRTVVSAMQNLVWSRDEAGWAAWLARPIEEPAADWLHQARAVLLPRYLRHVLNARPEIAGIVPLLRLHPPLPGAMAGNVATILEELSCLPDAEDLPAAIERLLQAARVGSQGKKAWPDADVYELIKTALEKLRGELRDLKLERFAVDPELLAPVAEVGRRMIRVAQEVERTYRDLKLGHGVLDFQDLLTLARDLLRDRTDLRARLQERYRFLLIDELQDTDPVQMQVVEYLCGGGLVTGKLFAVGDHSQSIYRFRGADVSLFQNLRDRMSVEGRQSLTVNYRSQPAILQFTNLLLGRSLTDYESLRAHRPQTNTGPCVEFLWTPCEDTDSATEARMREAEGIARRLAVMIEREELVVERSNGTTQLRSVRRGDIVLLFRAMTNVPLYEAALRKYGIDYYLVGGRAFFAQQEVYDILNLLRALDNPQDEVCLAGTLRSPFCCLNDEALFVLRYTPNPSAPSGWSRQPLWTALQDDRQVERLTLTERTKALRARDNLLRWRELKDRLPIARLLDAVIAASGFDAALQLEFLGERKLANLWKLTDLARTFDRSGLFGLAEFIARLSDLVGAQPREEQAAAQPENADVVRLMSIHQAKGLEFPVVVIPDIDARTGGSYLPAAVWDSQLGCVVRPPSDEDPPPFVDFVWGLHKVREEVEDWDESLRTLYVACTRAEDCLILSAGRKPSAHAQSPWMITLQERFDITTGNCLVDEPGETIPAVRVVNELILAEPLPRPQSRERGLRPERDAAPAPIPVRLSGQRVFTVDELEARLNGAAGPLTGQSVGEDRSDRNSWKTPDRPSVPADLAVLAGARACHRDIEFLLSWPADPPPAGLDHPPVIQGHIDCAWQDTQGTWRLLCLVTEPPVPDGEPPFRPGLVFSLFAAKQLFGAWPTEVLAFSAADRSVSRHRASLWQAPQLMNRFGTVLSDQAAGRSETHYGSRSA